MTFYVPAVGSSSAFTVRSPLLALIASAAHAGLSRSPRDGAYGVARVAPEAVDSHALARQSGCADVGHGRE